nr:glycerol-3-phosphate dehydrogenase [Alteromonas ponticola]
MIIGGGINGAGIAADAAGRGLSVVLCEQGDLGSATSSSSSKLIHGGLRYLEQREFRLVYAALKEREVLLKKAPHIMRPLRFRLPHQPHLRPQWLIRLGLFIYDRLAKRNQLEPSRKIHCDASGPLSADIKTCFEYSDAWVDDARLVVLNALAARDKGASIRPRTTFLHADQQQQHWLAKIQSQHGKTETIRARAIVNAAGPWVMSTLHNVAPSDNAHSMRLVKGSHIVVPKLYSAEHAYILQHEDQRIVFVIPYENYFSLIGTTDVDFNGDPGDVQISDNEKKYLLSIVNRYFTTQTSIADIVHTFSGVRPLLEEENTSAQAVTRGYKLTLSGSTEEAVLMNVFGGKITTYRRLAEQAVNKLARYFPAATHAWTATVPLPGGSFDSKSALRSEYQQRFPWLADDLCGEYVCRYGRLCEQFLDDTSSMAALGEHFGHNLYQTEVDYLHDKEWAQTVEDILWRRTKKGLLFSAEQVNHLQHYLSTLMN